MSKNLYRYSFNPELPIEEVEASLLLTVLALQGLHGEASTRLDGAYYFDAEKRGCVIDAGTVVGRDFNRLFVSFLMREFGNDSFTVTRVEKEPQEVAA
jgi:hypothetical protein